MLGILNKQDGDIVVFHIWKSLNYNRRLWLSFLMILSGMVVQFITFSSLPGILLLLTGNLLLITKGYTNVVDMGRYNPESGWEEVKPENLDQVISINKKMKRWDLSAFEVTNLLGSFVFVFVILPMIVLFIYAYINKITLVEILAIDFIVLLVPHWFTGIRNILKTPKLVNKVNNFKKLIAASEENLNDFKVKYYMLLRGEKTKIPDDIKIFIKRKGQPEDVLGLYGQISINSVDGKDYPYFYTVLVTKHTYPLNRINEKWSNQSPFVNKYEEKKEVKLIVLRQHTTKNSGYYTSLLTQKLILADGLKMLVMAE